MQFTARKQLESDCELIHGANLRKAVAIESSLSELFGYNNINTAIASSKLTTESWSLHLQWRDNADILECRISPLSSTNSETATVTPFLSRVTICKPSNPMITAQSVPFSQFGQSSSWEIYLPRHIHPSIVIHVQIITVETLLDNVIPLYSLSHLQSAEAGSDTSFTAFVQFLKEKLSQSTQLYPSVCLDGPTTVDNPLFSLEDITSLVVHYLTPSMSDDNLYKELLDGKSSGAALNINGATPESNPDLESKVIQWIPQHPLLSTALLSNNQPLDSAVTISKRIMHYLLQSLALGSLGRCEIYSPTELLQSFPETRIIKVDTCHLQSVGSAVSALVGLPPIIKQGAAIIPQSYAAEYEAHFLKRGGIFYNSFLRKLLSSASLSSIPEAAILSSIN